MVGATTHTQQARAPADTRRKAWRDAAEVTSVLCLPDQLKKKRKGKKRPKPLFWGVAVREVCETIN